MTQQRRRTDSRWSKFERGVTLGAVVLAGIAVIQTNNTNTSVRHTVEDLKNEARVRTDATCTIFETNQRGDVDALAQTYRYLAGLSKAELAQSLNRAVLAQLPRTIREATTDDAPAYCDAKDSQGRDVGLPEPDPVLPPRPKNIPRP